MEPWPVYYGLKQAGRKWYDTLCKVLAEIGFKQSEADPAVFYHQGPRYVTVLLFLHAMSMTAQSQATLSNQLDLAKIN